MTAVHRLISYVGLFSIVALIYGLWAIQPMSADEWGITGQSFYFPESGQELRVVFSRSFLVTSPFSLFKPWSLLVGIFASTLIWAALKGEHVLKRTAIVLIAMLGYPYLGQVGAWNLAGSDYGVAAVWMVIWYSALRFFRYNHSGTIVKGILLLVTSFFASVWHEVWLVSFSMIAAFLFFEAIYLWKKDPKAGLKISSNIIVVIGYCLALAYYTNGGTEQFIDVRGQTSNFLGTLLNWPRVTETIIKGTKESMVLIKDCLPIFMLIGYIKLGKNFDSRFESDFKLFLAGSLGAMLFLYVAYFLIGSIHWRARWLCTLMLAAACYASPRAVWMSVLGWLKVDRHKNILRKAFLAVAIGWFLFNAYFTYYYNNIDVAGWQQFRKMVVAGDPRALGEFCCRTLPEGRPKGVAHWDSVWGAQDDRYRFFMAPIKTGVDKDILAYWAKKGMNLQGVNIDEIR